MDVVIKGIYRHYKCKDNLYIVEEIAVHSETLEKMVVYRALYDDCKLWVRPYDMFVGNVNGVPRFKRVYVDDKRSL